MRKLLPGVSLVASGLFSLLLVALAAPLLAAMSADRRARSDADDRWSFPELPYDDDDPGTDIDDERAAFYCEQCLVMPLAYDGARFCGAACCAASEMHLPKGPL